MVNEFHNYALVLPSWYPTKSDPFPGDFNQRQVLSTAPFCPQIVLYIGKDLKKRIAKVEVTYNAQVNGLLEIVILYPQKKNILYDKIHSFLQYWWLNKKWTNSIIKKYGQPKLVHVYVALKAGIIGKYIAKKFKIPFVLTEHWTIYHPQNSQHYWRNKSFNFKVQLKSVFKNIQLFLPVTQNLGLQTKSIYNGAIRHIPNVVDTKLFNFKNNRTVEKPYRLLHVSAMGYQKNVIGMLEAIEELNNSLDFTLTLVGPMNNDVKEKLANSPKLREKVVYKGEIEYSEVAETMQNQDALVLFSRYENLPCVILEAFCCGLPVLSSNVGGISEVVNESNGILVESENKERFKNGFSLLLERLPFYDRAAIAANAAEMFAYDTVGRQIAAAYAVAENIYRRKK